MRAIRIAELLFQVVGCELPPIRGHGAVIGGSKPGFRRGSRNSLTTYKREGSEGGYQKNQFHHTRSVPNSDLWSQFDNVLFWDIASCERRSRMPVSDGRNSVHRPRYRAIVALLKQVRKDAGLSQEQLAAKLKRSRTYVTKCELGERRLDLLEWLEYCRACGAEPTDFLARLKQR